MTGTSENYNFLIFVFFLFLLIPQVRRNVSKQLPNDDCQTDGDGSEMDSNNKEELLETIDNALLKCYLQASHDVLKHLIVKLARDIISRFFLGVSYRPTTL